MNNPNNNINGIKFYNNNPCKVVRVVNETFSEVEVYPQFDDDMSGSNWCIECMIGNQGTPSSHTCDIYQEVIDAIHDSKKSILVVVENRLLASEPIEFKAWKKMRDEVDKMRIDKADSLNRKIQAEMESKRLAEYITELKEQIYDAEVKLDNFQVAIAASESKFDRLNYELGKLDSKISIGSVSITMSASDLKSLISSKIELEALRSGGVDNWEWYDESSIDYDDLESEIDKEIKQLSVSWNGE